ncbi:MAG: protein TonB [Pseudohongiella sp.]|nr:MAG: protein TonB [Pseudohongiella sp.]
MYAIGAQFVKLNTVFLLAVSITLLLFYFMQALIANDDEPFEPPKIFNLVDVTFPEIELVEIEEIAKPEVIEAPEFEPQPEVRTTDAPSTNIPVTVAYQPSAPAKPGLFDIVITDNVMVPIIKTVATYPASALRRGIEGYVDLSFTVTPLGTIEDVKVLYAEPEGVFERSAVRSIRRWKYSPAIENGEPVPVHDVRQRIVFEMRK